MKTRMTNEENEFPNVVLAQYGEPKIGKTYVLATGRPLGNVLHLSVPSEGNAAECFEARGYQIHQVVLEDYSDLIALEGYLLDKPVGWLGDPDDPLIVKPKHGTTTAQYEQLAGLLGKDHFATIGIDTIINFCHDLFVPQVIEVRGAEKIDKDGWALYGDLIDLLRVHLRRLRSMAGIKFIVLISHLELKEVKDRAGNTIKSWFEFSAMGKQMFPAINRMSDFICPIFRGQEILQKAAVWGIPIPPGWKPDWKFGDEVRDRWLMFRPVDGHYAGARSSKAQQFACFPADLSQIWKVFYTQAKQATDTKSLEFKEATNNA